MCMQWETKQMIYVLDEFVRQKKINYDMVKTKLEVHFMKCKNLNEQVQSMQAGGRRIC